MSFSSGFKKQAMIGTVVKKLVKAQGGGLNATLNAVQGYSDTNKNLEKFKAAERGIGGIR